MFDILKGQNYWVALRKRSELINKMQLVWNELMDNSFVFNINFKGNPNL